MSKQIVVWCCLAAGLAAGAVFVMGRGRLFGAATSTSKAATKGAAAPTGRQADRQPAQPSATERAPSGVEGGDSAAASQRVPTERDATSSQPAGPAGAAPGEAEPSAQQPIVTEQLARNAMQLVGRDPVAEAIWLRAINDPGLSKGARTDLIEDLADEGFPSPATRDDLPLIEARLKLIERHSPYAMDDVNAAAFREAYKDLLSVLVRLRGAGSR